MTQDLRSGSGDSLRYSTRVTSRGSSRVSGRAVMVSASGVMLAIMDAAVWVGLGFAATTVAIAAASARWARQSARCSRQDLTP
jgi:Flp pilus assembly protein TadB